MKKFMKKFTIIITSILFVLQPFSNVVSAATVPPMGGIIAYTISNGNVNTYKSVNGAYSGYISGASDLCNILEVYDSGWCKVSYPTSRGAKTAYTQTSNFFGDTNFSNAYVKLGKNMTVYRKSSGNQRIGSVYSSDSVLITGQANNRTQIIYPISNGKYKMGWVSGTYSSNTQVEANVANGYYQILSAGNSNYVIDVYNASTANCANIILYQNNYQTNQGFLIKKQSNGYYSISALHSNRVFDVENGGRSNGSNVIQYEYHGGDNQLWKIVKTNDGYYSFINKQSGLYLDVNGASFSNGTNIQVWEGNNTSAQKFLLSSVTVNGNGYSEGSSNSTSNTKGKQLADSLRNKVGISYPNGYCLKFVEESYQNAGGKRPYHCCASHSGDVYIQSSSKDNIPLGATVYFGNCGGGSCRSCGNRYFGHVGIYVGDGQFVHATGGKVQLSSLNETYWSGKYRGYGFLGGFDVN